MKSRFDIAPNPSTIEQRNSCPPPPIFTPVVADVDRNVNKHLLLNPPIVPRPPVYIPTKVPVINIASDMKPQAQPLIVTHEYNSDSKLTSGQLLANVLASINEQRANEPMILIAKDPAYCEKVNAALQRSFAYIERKDRIAAGLLVETPIGSGNAHKTMDKRKKFSNLLSNKRINGIGHANESNPNPSSNANPNLHTTSVYVAGLPLDYTEHDLSKDSVYMYISTVLLNCIL